jgi:hypothetical protein
MAHEPLPFERFAEQFARRLAGGSIQPGQLMARVRTAVLEGVRDGAMPNQVRILLHPDDYEEYRPALSELQGMFGAELARIEQENGFRRVGQLSATIIASTEAARLSPLVEAQFVHTEHRSAAPRRGATRTITPIQGWRVVIDGGAGVQLTFVPFTIGRAADCDLVLPSPAVSSRHARIIKVSAGFQVEDLGSRNGIVVEGTRVARLALYDGSTFVIGDIPLRLEHAR